MAYDKPDLTAENVRSDKPIVRIDTDSYDFRARVLNQGDAAAEGYGVYFRLSPSQQPSPDDITSVDFFKSTKKRLEPGQGRNFKVRKNRLPYGKAKKGTYYLGVTVDPSKKVDESNEANNTVYSEQQVIIADRYGNGAVDPRLGYTDEAKAEAATHDNEVLPYTTPITAWDSKTILTTWTQIDGAGDASAIDYTSSDEVRCGPTSALASVVMSGPAAVYKFAFNVSGKGPEKLGAIDTSTPEGAKVYAATSRATAMCIGALTELAMGTATYGTLSRIAHATKVLMTTSEGAAATGHEMNDIIAMAGPKETGPGLIKDRAAFEAALADLKLGQKYMVNVDTDVRLAHRNTDRRMAPEANHWTMIARVGSQSKRIVLYDPYPREGKQIMFEDDAAFWKYFENDDGAWRGCVIASKSGEGVGR